MENPTTQDGNEPVRTGTLDSKQRWRLWQWLIAARPQLEKDNASRDEAAALATKAVGFPVSRYMIASAIEAGVVAPWVVRRPSVRELNSRLLAQVEELARRVARLEQTVARLTGR